MKTVRSGWSGTLIVCVKCSKKLDGGFGPKGRLPLARALRKHLRLKKGRKAAAGIVESRCLGICPRNAVTVVRGAEPHLWHIVPAGADLDSIAETLLPATQAIVPRWENSAAIQALSDIRTAKE